MKINNSTPNFKARNPDIRFADHICRMVNAKVPTISPTKFISEGELQKNSKKFYFGHLLQKKLELIVREPGLQFSNKCNNINFYKFFVPALKKAKLSNCGERARLAALICAVNGIETKITSLWTVTKKLALSQNLDHAVLMISPSSEDFNCGILSNMNDKIIIDPWFGITDYANNVNLEYRKYFERYKNIDKDFEDLDNMHFAIFHKEEITNENTEELRKIFPEFIINKK